MQDCSNSSADALELLQSWTKTSMWLQPPPDSTTTPPFHKCKGHWLRTILPHLEAMPQVTYWALQTVLARGWGGRDVSSTARASPSAAEGSHSVPAGPANHPGTPEHQTTSAAIEITVSERMIKFNGLSGDSGQRGSYSPREITGKSFYNTLSYNVDGFEQLHLHG